VHQVIDHSSGIFFEVEQKCHIANVSSNLSD